VTSKGGKESTGEAKRRGDSLGAKGTRMCPRCHGAIRGDTDRGLYWTPKPGTMGVPCDDCTTALVGRIERNARRG
jgi:hypothetical protein